jgi:hypothetical protein
VQGKERNAESETRNHEEQAQGTKRHMSDMWNWHVLHSG